MWSIRIRKDGSKILLKDYQKIILLILFEKDTPIGTGELWKLTDIKLDKSISRASVIFFLQDLAKYGYAQETTGTGKGGHHRLYKITMTKEQFIIKISTDVNTKLIEAFEDIFPEQELSFLSFS